jgi:hypothetical protein
MRSWKTVPRHQKLADDSAEIFENNLMEKKKGLRGQAFLYRSNIATNPRCRW